MLFYYFGGGGEEKNYGGGDINPLLPRVEKLGRLHFPFLRENRGEAPSLVSEADLPKKEFGGIRPASRGTVRDRSRLPRGSSHHGESGVSAGPRPLRWSEQRGRREKMGPASRETVERIGGRRGREKRKAGRNLCSPSPAT